MLGHGYTLTRTHTHIHTRTHIHTHTHTHTQIMLIHKPIFFILRKTSRLKISYLPHRKHNVSNVWCLLQ